MDVLVIGGVFREVLDADTAPRLRYGGSGLTASVAAARFGARVALGSYVGSEDEQAVRTELAAAEVDDSAVVTLAGASGTFFFPTHEDHERPWPMYRPAEHVPSQMPELPQADVVVAFGIPDCDPVEMGWLGAGDSNSTIIWDRQGLLSRARGSKGIVGLQARAHIYLANELEAIADAKAGSLAEALGLQPPRGFEVAVVKRGDAGVIVVERGDEDPTRSQVPAFVVSAKSSVGSGDVFAGVLAARLAQGDAPASAAKWGCAAAAVALHTQQNLLSSDGYQQALALMRR